MLRNTCRCFVNQSVVVEFCVYHVVSFLFQRIIVHYAVSRGLKWEYVSSVQSDEGLTNFNGSLHELTKSFWTSSTHEHERVLVLTSRAAELSNMRRCTHVENAPLCCVPHNARSDTFFERSYKEEALSLFRNLIVIARNFASRVCTCLNLYCWRRFHN